MKISKLKKMRSDEPCFGTWLSTGSPTVTELAAQCGFDWLLLDMEHGCLPEAELLANLRATRGEDVVMVVRVPTHEAGLIGRVLDWGANAIMVPHVETAEEAEALVRAMRYPPQGGRGYSRTVRAYDYGLNEPEAQPTPFLFVQIESVNAVQNAGSIASVEGVDALFVGPADLKLSLSINREALSYEQSLAHITAETKKHGIHAGILIRDQGETEKLIRQGFTKVAIDSDMAILRRGFLSAIPKSSQQPVKTAS